ncbi:alpha/beta hydrolase [Endozoicomonas arenosclerae]|uniref:alpha/beta hydrolase n=1 Tax=Endozoicomonas arenosclerae TaxID=1633495 RepID=UPI00078404AC|nr:alpha/beta hydrolase family protein [Endozoicomonas arenosclerae]
MKQNIILVHGAWHGSWCWHKIIPGLSSAGFKVFTPCLPGMGERHDEDATGITLTFCIDDLQGQIKRMVGNEAFTLVGHSFSGAVVTAIADRMVDQLHRLIILDGCFLESGETLFGKIEKSVVESRLQSARDYGNDRMPPPQSEFFGIKSPCDLKWVREHLSHHPVQTYQTPAPQRQHALSEIPAHYLHCTNPSFSTIEPYYDEAVKLGWPTRKMEVPHDLMITHPELTVDFLLGIAKSGKHSSDA